MTDPNKNQKKFDLIKRGERTPTPWGTVTFIGLRALDLPLQHALLRPGGLGTSLLSRVGLTPALPVAVSVLRTGLPLIDSLGHPSNVILFLMACGSTLKQIYWQTSLSFESFPVSAASAVSVYNTFVNSVNTFLFLTFTTTSLRSSPTLTIPLPFLSTPNSTITLPLSTVVGTILYITGLTLETTAERQRKAFKNRPENQGKVCKVGVWSWARHINYFGYSLWRGGYAMVGAGWTAGLIVGLGQMWDLSSRAVSVLDEYCSNRYGAQWVQFKKDVPYKIIPGIY
ncbi:uncharacterized protein F4822DRAFT_410400 [Hypoxylon trugodes]|uniref:uncharacterized protein n=1 Tax=Hypoxylon trugodes TaxID=326681 RepID=UPI002190B156|nr:uncharacterized protein F4822DRAFT_410400 [Hypoxylon trugodes]KAI1386532.1 hypothetical protein F4822DRAFT_410400 [Hypoxylon trugodes]